MTRSLGIVDLKKDAEIDNAMHLCFPGVIMNKLLLSAHISEIITASVLLLYMQVKMDNEYKRE